MISSFEVGVPINTIYDKTLAVFKEEKDEAWMTEHMPDNFGHGIGFIHQENHLEISATNTTKVARGHVFYLKIALSLTRNDEKPYAICIADTMVVRDSVDVVT